INLPGTKTLRRFPSVQDRRHNDRHFGRAFCGISWRDHDPEMLSTETRRRLATRGNGPVENPIDRRFHQRKAPISEQTPHGLAWVPKQAGALRLLVLVMLCENR